MSSGLIYTVHVKLEDGVNTVAFGPDSAEIPDWALEQIGAHAFENGEKPEPKAKKSKKKDKGEKSKSGDDGGQQDPPPPPAPSWTDATVKDLKAEIETRNADRDEDSQIVPEEPGNKPELVAALEADDKAQAEA